MPHQKHWHTLTPIHLPPLPNSPLNILKLFLPTRQRVPLPAPILLFRCRLPESALVERKYGETAVLRERGVDVGVPRDVLVEPVDEDDEGLCGGGSWGDVSAGVEEGVLGAKEVGFFVGWRCGHRGVEANCKLWRVQTRNQLST